MKKIIVLFIVLFLLLLQPVYAVDNIVEALIVERNIVYGMGGNLGKQASNPILSYNDLTYVSVKDFSKLLNVDAVWLGEKQGVLLKQKPEKTYAVKQEETALAIGKAIIEEYFGSRLSESSVFACALSSPVSTGFRQYKVFVKFNADETLASNSADLLEKIASDYDACVSINPSNGEIMEVYHKNENGD